MDSANAYELTVMHNLKGLTDHANRRMAQLIRPLSAIETLNSRSRILVIGPRTESDILHLMGYGFRSKNIRGLDLISYSPWIDLGDMHSMPYGDDTWDAVILGWCLSYSKNPRKLAEEVIRVAKNGAIVAIGLEYSTLTPEDSKELCGYSIVPEGSTNRRINSVSEILALFAERVDQVYFSHDAPLKFSHTASALLPFASAVAVIFSLKKTLEKA